MAGRRIFAGLFLIAGSFHLIVPQFYVRIMPPYLPWHLGLVYLSGVCEMLGGAGILLRQTRQAAGWGLVALLIAVMPANVYMATHPASFSGIPAWALWLRLPLQLPLIILAWSFTRPQREDAGGWRP